MQFDLGAIWSGQFQSDANPQITVICLKKSIAQ
jgi:hypothetical protein